MKLKEQAEFMPFDGAGLRVALVAARFNPRLVEGLLNDALRALDDAGVATADIETFRVPGSGEIPYVAGMLADTGEFDAVLALGVIIEGETPHADVLGHATAAQLQEIAFETRIPVVNGIILARNEAQAAERTIGAHARGRELARTTLEMADWKLRLNDRLAEAEDRAAAEDEKAAGETTWDGPEEGEEWKS